MPKVYVVQQHLHKNHLGVLEPKYDLSPAANYGEIVFCLKVDTHPNDGQKVLEQLRDALADITEEDYILPIGSTILMCLTSVVASELVGKLNFLYWSPRSLNYRSNSYDLDLGAGFDNGGAYNVHR